MKHGPEPARRRLPPQREPRDPAQRRTAARLQQSHPHWLVMYGPWSRQYWAYACFDVPQGMILAATDPRELASLMHQAELAARLDVKQQ